MRAVIFWTGNGDGSVQTGCGRKQPEKGKVNNGLQVSQEGVNTRQTSGFVAWLPDIG